MRGSQLGLQRDDAGGGLGVIVGAAAVGQREHRGDMPRIGGQDLGVLLVAVVGLVGQAQSGLVQVHQVAGGVLGIGVDVQAGAAAHAGALQSAQHGGQRVRAVGGVDGGQLVAQRLQADPRHGVFVHEAGVQVADALLVGPGCRPGLGSLGDQVADLLLGAVEQRPERAVGGAVGRNLVVGQPAAVDVAEQIVLGAGIRVDMAQVDSRANGFYRHANILPDGCGPLSSRVRVAESTS